MNSHSYKALARIVGSTATLFVIAMTFENVFALDPFRTVALTGTMDAATGANFSQLPTIVQLNNLGQISFRGRLSGPGVDASNDFGIWQFEASAGRTLIVRKGDTTPDGGGHFSSVGASMLNASGGMVFQATASDGGGSYGALWSRDQSGIERLVRQGDLAPGTAANFEGMSNIEIADDGDVVFSAGLTSTFDSGIWRYQANAVLAPIAIEGTAAPGTTAMFTSFGGYSMDNQGQVQLVSGLSDVQGGATQTAGVWRDKAGSLELLARAGDAAPGTSVVFQDFGFGPQPRLDENGHAAFIGYLEGSGVIGTNNTGIWSERGGAGLQLLIRSGDTLAPGTGGQFQGFDQLRQNDLGQIAFVGSLAGVSSATDHGVWSERDGSGLMLAAREGNIAPGTNLSFTSFLNGTLAQNVEGQIAFTAEVRDLTQPRPIGRNSLWAQDRDGQLHLITMQDALFDVSDDPTSPDFRTVSSLFFIANGLNDSGQLAFFASFTDGSSGIFISNLVAVPEPDGRVFALLAMLVSSYLFRQR